MSAAAAHGRPKRRRRFTRIFSSRNYTVLLENHAKEGQPQLRRHAALELELAASDLAVPLVEVTPEPGLVIVNGVCHVSETAGQRRARLREQHREAQSWRHQQSYIYAAA